MDNDGWMSVQMALGSLSQPETSQTDRNAHAVIAQAKLFQHTLDAVPLQQGAHRHERPPDVMIQQIRGEL